MIENYVPIGKKNAVSREYLCSLTCMNDRQVRNEISKATTDRNVLIINTENGYFIPDDSEEDKQELQHYYARERRKAISILRRLKTIRIALSNDDNQLTLEDI